MQNIGLFLQGGGLNTPQYPFFIEHLLEMKLCKEEHTESGRK